MIGQPFATTTARQRRIFVASGSSVSNEAAVQHTMSRRDRVHVGIVGRSEAIGGDAYMRPTWQRLSGPKRCSLCCWGSAGIEDLRDLPGHAVRRCTTRSARCGLMTTSLVSLDVEPWCSGEGFSPVFKAEAVRN